MKLNRNYIVHKTGNETILVPTSEARFSGIIRGNTVLGAILKLLTQETTEVEILDELQKRFDAPKESLVRDVTKVLSELRRIGALDE